MQPASRRTGLPLRLALATLLATTASAAPQWLSEPKLVPPSPAVYFGMAAAMDDDVLLVGARTSTAGVTFAGAVYVLRRTPGWSQTLVLAASDPSENAWFGDSIALDGDLAVIGAPFASGGGGVYAFHLVTGAQLGKLLPSDVVTGDEFGASVAIQGNLILAGAPAQAVGTLSEAGAVYAFGGDGSVLAKLTASDAVANDEFGRTVAISGTTVVVGALRSDGPSVANQGAVYVFDRTTWSEQQRLVASDPAMSDHFGRSIAIDGDTLLVCSNDAGYVFVRQGATWVQEARLSPDWPDGDAVFMVGALSGDRVLLGLRHDDVVAESAGSAAVFVRSGGTWTLEQRMLAPDGALSDTLGWSVALSGSHAAVLAPLVDAGPSPNRGALYPYELDAHRTFCHGDALQSCPCGSAGALDAGCDNPQGTGGVRAEFMGVDRDAMEASLVATGFPPAGAPTAIAIRSAALEAVPQPFFDGVRCIATDGLVRLAASIASNGASRHEVRHLAAPGTYHYQVWYRSTPACTGAPSNVSSGDSLTW